MAADFQVAPRDLPPDTVHPRALAFGATPAEWASRREAIGNRWLELLGPFPEKHSLKPHAFPEESFPLYTRWRVHYRVEETGGGIWAEAYLLVPKLKGRRAPAIIFFHPTTPDTIREPVGLAGPASRHNAVELAERGYVVLCPRCFLWDYRGHTFGPGARAMEGIHAVTRMFLDQHPGWTGMGKMVWDGIRAVDFVQTLEMADPERIGCMGFSLGAKEALYLAAFDERVKAAVSIDGGIAISYSNWHDPWYLDGKVKAPGFAMDHHEVLALVAPRAFLLAGSVGGVDEETGERSRGYDGERSWPFVEAVLPLYRMLGAPDAVGNLVHPHGHSVPKVVREAAYRWFDRFLSGVKR